MIAHVIVQAISIALLILLNNAQIVDAFDGGDAAALMIGLFIGVFGFFACLGYYARKRGGVWHFDFVLTISMQYSRLSFCPVMAEQIYEGKHFATNRLHCSCEFWED